jgi:hypothetical protein
VLIVMSKREIKRNSRRGNRTLDCGELTTNLAARIEFIRATVTRIETFDQNDKKCWGIGGWKKRLWRIKETALRERSFGLEKTWLSEARLGFLPCK